MALGDQSVNCLPKFPEQGIHDGSSLRWFWSFHHFLSSTSGRTANGLVVYLSPLSGHPKAPTDITLREGKPPQGEGQPVPFRIKLGNQAFQTRVATLTGGVQYLEAAGFVNAGEQGLAGLCLVVAPQACMPGKAEKDLVVLPCRPFHWEQR